MAYNVMQLKNRAEIRHKLKYEDKIMSTENTINEATNPACFLGAVISRFSENQSLKTIGELRNLGIGLKQLKNNRWERLSEYKLPLERWILLYNDKLEVSDIGVY